jgi:curved DNA-binding protein
VLSDPAKRRRYEALGAGWRDGESFRPPPDWGDGMHVEYRAGPGGGMGGDWSDFFEAFFGGGGAPQAGGRGGRVRVSGGPFGARGRAGVGGVESLDPTLEDLFGGGFAGARGRPRARPGADVEGELEITLEDALRGATRTVQLQSGEGEVKTYEIKIPVGVHDGARIRLAGRGGHGRAGGPDGDLLLTLRLAPHPKFRLEGEADLVVVVPITPWEAALGATVTVPTPDGPVEMKLPAGRSSGDRLRLRGKGMPRRETGRGDLYAELRIAVPARLSERERKLFEELREASSFDPRKS